MPEELLHSVMKQQESKLEVWITELENSEPHTPKRLEFLCKVQAAIQILLPLWSHTNYTPDETLAERIRKCI